MAKAKRKREPAAIRRGNQQKAGSLEANLPAPDAPGLIDATGPRGKPLPLPTTRGSQGATRRRAR
jgi:hypothetical protein